MSIPSPAHTLPKGRVKLGTLLADIGREVGDVALETERDQMPAEPVSFE